ncbi:MAG: hypothetical protein RIC55_01585 [Pirellulaceae bacterium]
MNFLSWLTGRFSDRGKSLACYKRAMARAKKHDHQGAIDGYTMTIGMAETPADVKAMALYNRALVYAVTGEAAKAFDDLNFVLAMKETLVNVKTMARQKLARMNHASGAANP